MGKPIIKVLPLLLIISLSLYITGASQATQATIGKPDVFPWQRYNQNPILSSTTEGLASWGSVVKVGSVYHMFYSCFRYNTVIAHATSWDGKTWTEDTAHNPVLVGTVGSWDADRVWCPIIWFENAIFHMIYTGASGTVYKVGLATSPDGIHWTKDLANPILSPSQGWEGTENEAWGLIKDSEIYYLWYDVVTIPRQSGVAWSTDLHSWTKDPTNPQFTGNRYCPDLFKYKDEFYLLIPHYTTGTFGPAELELYKCPNPKFHPNERMFLGVAMPISSDWYDIRGRDTPWFLADDITKSSFSLTGNVLYCYYGAHDNTTAEINWHMALAFANVSTTPKTPVGGIHIPVNKLELLTPYIGLTTLLAVAVITVGYTKKRKKGGSVNSSALK